VGIYLRDGSIATDDDLYEVRHEDDDDSFEGTIMDDEEEYSDDE